jgi:hypothetical protein
MCDSTGIGLSPYHPALMGPPCRQLPLYTKLPHLEMVHVRFEHMPCVLNAQGKLKLLGTFENRVEAARHYDQEAIKHYGADAILNFPADESPSHPFGGTCGHVPVVPLHEQHREEPSAGEGLLPAGEEPSASEGSLPAGVPESTSVTVPGSVRADDGGPRVSLT